MLSNLVITTQKFVLIIDNVGEERIASTTIKGLLQEQGQCDPVKTFNIFDDNFVLRCTTLLENCSASETKVNVLLPALSDINLHHPKKSDLFQIIHKLKLHRNVKQIFVWASIPHLFETFTVGCLEYMADIVLRIENKDRLSILIKKSGGSVAYKHYSYKKTENSFEVEEIKKTNKKTEKLPMKPEHLGTFKIELEEDELVARKALKMPYEKTSEAEVSGGGNIIYTPDKDDDFDEEDPDDDLYI